MNEERNILAERIYKMRKELNLTQEELALKLGLKGKSSIANYESGKITPSDEIKSKMCEVFGCTMDYLMGNSEFKTNEDTFNDYLNRQKKILILKTIDRYYYEYVVPFHLKEDDINFIVDLLSNVNSQNVYNTKKQIKQYVDSFDISERKEVKELIDIIIKELIDDLKDKSRFNYFMNLLNKDNQNKINNSPDYYMCPVYGQISAGQPNWAEQNIEGRLPIDTDLMDIINPEEYFFLRVNGESMNNVIRNGAFALIHKQDVVEDGEIAVVLVNGYDATLKRFTKKGDVVVLEPDSSDPSFKTQIYDKTTSIKILGKYVGKMEINK